MEPFPTSSILNYPLVISTFDTFNMDHEHRSREFQNPKMEVLYHMRPYFPGAFRSIGRIHGSYLQFFRFLSHGHGINMNKSLEVMICLTTMAPWVLSNQQSGSTLPRLPPGSSDRPATTVSAPSWFHHASAPGEGREQVISPGGDLPGKGGWVDGNYLKIHGKLHGKLQH